MPREPRESAAQKIDREWRELANDAIDDQRLQMSALKELVVSQIHELDKDLALMKLKVAIVSAAFGFIGSMVTTIVAKWILKL